MELVYNPNQLSVGQDISSKITIFLDDYYQNVEKEFTKIINDSYKSKVDLSDTLAVDGFKGIFDGINRYLDKLNSNFNVYSSLLSQYNDLANEYNSLVKQYNSLIGSTNSDTSRLSSIKSEMNYKENQMTSLRSINMYVELPSPEGTWCLQSGV